MWAYINGILKVQSQIEQIRKAASAVHNNFANSTKNLNKLKNSIESTVSNWNTLVGNVEGRLIPSVKKLEEMGAIVTEYNLNDQTVSGMRLKDRPVFSVQYHPEASPGPNDANHLFRAFHQLVSENKKG